jgi:hypothetical protein
LTPDLAVEVSIHELYGDFRNASQPLGRLALRFTCFELKDGATGRIVFDRVSAHGTPLAGKSPAALMAAWETDLREIMQEITSGYEKANPNH